MAETNNKFDTIIIGAGISGINAAYRLQERCPHHRYAILDGRGELGGTWAFFKYPGIRSDTDLFTFGYPWNPWTEEREIATAPAILEYLRQSAQKFGIDEHIRFNSFVDALEWKSDQQTWQLTVLRNHSASRPTTEPPVYYYAKYIVMGTGYYDYNTPLEVNIPGLSLFKGTIVHPQFWDEKLDYSNKRVAIIGSGATAVTLLPAMTPQASRVTMIQRSPGYFIMPPLPDSFNYWARKLLPSSIAYKVMRWRAIFMSFLIVQLSQLFPNYIGGLLKDATAKRLPKDGHLSVERDFTPKYTPFQQRICISPGGDFFRALRSGKGDVKTGAIASVEAHGVRMQDGTFIEADIIITATGLRIQFGGHAKLRVDGQDVTFGEKLVWQGCMLQGVPNFTFVVGYVDGPWTLAADACCRMFTRLILEAERRGASRIVPVLTEKEENEMNVSSYIRINSTYFQAARQRNEMPKAGDRAPWLPRQYYYKDHWNAEYGSLKGLVFDKQSVN
jgi:cation diffusion facilitator CzcD-associated flavoprotein CzcO